MRPPGQNRSLWELKNELNKSNVRWFLIVLVSAYLIYRLRIGEWPPGTVSGHIFISLLASGFSVLNLFLVLLLLRIRKRDGTLHPAVKYLSMGADLLVISLIIPVTGGTDSMFYLIYFIVIISNGMRYGIRSAIAALLLANFFYVITLALFRYPELRLPDMSREALKIAGVWLVGLYIGYLSRRFEILQGELEKVRSLLNNMSREGGENHESG